MRDKTNKQNMMTYSLNLIHACSITEHTERPLMRLKKTIRSTSIIKTYISSIYYHADLTVHNFSLRII
jgi:hypothetical protein